MGQTLRVSQDKDSQADNTLEIALQDKLLALELCQREKGLLSADSTQSQGCFACSQLESCDVRLSYVKAVYKSMNQGQNSDFDF